MVINWWENFREKTFEKWSQKLGVSITPVEGIDFNTHGNGIKSYPWDENRATEKALRLIMAKSETPFKYFLTQGLPNFIEWFVYSPVLFCEKVRDWFNYNIKERLHIVNTRLKPGYYDPDVRIENSIISILFDYVELDAAYKLYICETDRYNWNGKRNRKMGEEFMRWHIDEADNSDDVKLSMKKCLEAYIWLKDVHPVKQAAIDIMWDQDFKGKKDVFDKIMNAEIKLEKEYTKHLSNVVKHRRVLWT